jgi:hypothetical protein
MQKKLCEKNGYNFEFIILRTFEANRHEVRSLEAHFYPTTKRLKCEKFIYEQSIDMN